MNTLSEIINRCKAKDHRAQKLLYDRYYPYCIKIVFRYIFHFERAADVANDGFVKVFTKLDTFVCDQPLNLEIILMGWMKTIMINTAIDRLRKNNFVPELGLPDQSGWIEDHSESSHQKLLYKELILQIKKLPPAYRAVFNLYVIDGYTHQEIARHLRIAAGTSKSNLFKAKALLQKYIYEGDHVKAVC